jgi:hypothetical protein
VRPSGAASHLDLFEHPARRSKGASTALSESPREPGGAGKPALEQRLLRHAPGRVAILAIVLVAAVGGDWVIARAMDDAAEHVVNPLPPDERQQLVTGRCIICHSLETIAQQRQTRDEWAVILDRMVAYGMPMLPGDRELILEYLATRLGQ